MSAGLPLLPTMNVGSYASPGWFDVACRMLKKGELGPKDADELFDDALTVCVADQREAGVDILCDGELRRQRFVFELYDGIGGLERLPPERRLGVSGYDKAPHFRRLAALTAPGGLGIVEEFRALKRHVPDRPLKIALPGPLTFAAFIEPGPGSAADLVGELVTLVRAELAALVKVGADFIQLDEPALAVASHGLSLEAAAEAINGAFAGVEARIAVHVCFGNNAGRPFADRRLGRLSPALERLRCQQLVLEFTNRGMAEVELLGPLSRRFEIAAGVVDVKNFHVETPDDVAGRIERCLAFVPAEKLTVTADCGFSALPRDLARAKMQAMVAGARLARARLPGAA